MAIQFLPRTKPLKSGALAYGQAPLARVASVLAGAGFAALALLDPGATAMGTMAWLLVALILVVAALSVDSWTFFAPGTAPDGEVAIRRRFGLFPLLRTWKLPLSRLSSVCLRSGGPGESPNAMRSDKARAEASLLGMGRGDWVALGLVLDDGAFLVMTSARPAKASRLRADGERIAAQLSLSFVDSAGGSSS